MDNKEMEMSLDEAIEHLNDTLNSTDRMWSCDSCKREHEQLRNWLIELREMKNKYYNDAIIGNKKIIASYTEKGELQRLCYPEVDGRQFIDYFQTGVKINDSNLIYLHQDINNKYSQEYIENTNILKTNIKNTYFNFNIEQIDFALVDKNIIVKKYIFKNNNSVDLDTKFIINSKILSNDLERFGSRIVDKGI